jgi:hypothetical protein
MLPLLVVVTLIAIAAPLVSAGPVPLLVSAGAAVLGLVLGFALVWRARAGARALAAAVLILVNLVLVLRVILVPR